jgi:hypothetical protein
LLFCAEKAEFDHFLMRVLEVFVIRNIGNFPVG